MRGSFTLATLVALAGAPAPAQTGQALPGPAELFIRDPFVTPQALKGFKEYIDALSAEGGSPIPIPDGFWAAAPRIRYWGYTFADDPLAGEAGHGRYKLIFRQTHDVQNTVDSMLRVVGSLKEGGCSFYRAKDPTVQSLTLRQIVVVAQIEGKQRSCGDWPWPMSGGWATDVGDVGGSATARIDFRLESDPTATERFNGRFVADDPKIDVDAKARAIFGINTNSVAGQMLGFVVATGSDVFGFVKEPGTPTAEKMLNIFDDGALRFDSSVTMATSYLAGENGGVSSRKYNDFLDQMRRMRWSFQERFTMQDNVTGFVTESSTALLNLVYENNIRKHYPIATVYDDARREIALITSFAQSDEAVTIRRGDTLWRLANARYGSGVYHNLVAGYNGMPARARDRLQVGQTIMLPPLYKFEIARDVHFMRPGESASKLCKGWMPDDLQTCLRRLQQRNPGVGLRSLKVLEPLMLPDLTTPSLRSHTRS
jgi:nucleoid-associated protein YgaU